MGVSVGCPRTLKRPWASTGVVLSRPHLFLKRSRFHYTFNLRDISKVFQGFLMITASRCTTVETAVRLWAHECSRVFYDRLINREDQQWFEDLVVELLPRYLKASANSCCRTKKERQSAPHVTIGFSACFAVPMKSFVLFSSVNKRGSFAFLLQEFL